MALVYLVMPFITEEQANQVWESLPYPIKAMILDDNPTLREVYAKGRRPKEAEARNGSTKSV